MSSIHIVLLAGERVCAHASFNRIKSVVCRSHRPTYSMAHSASRAANIRNVNDIQCIGYYACGFAKIESNITGQQLICDSTSSRLSAYACDNAKIYGGSDLQVTCNGVLACNGAQFYDVPSVTCGGGLHVCQYAKFANKNGKYDVKCLYMGKNEYDYECVSMVCNYKNVGGPKKVKDTINFTSCWNNECCTVTDTQSWYFLSNLYSLSHLRN